MEQDWKRSPALRFVALLLLLVSPMGAPILGWLILLACEIPWDGQCPVPTPLRDYFLALAFMPVAWLGPFLALLWLFLAVAVLLACLWNAALALWQATMDRD
jgi:hypothetical protein